MHQKLQQAIITYAHTLDSRLYIVDVLTSLNQNQLNLTGRVTLPEQLNHILGLAQTLAPDVKLHTSIEVLATDQSIATANIQWAVADVRKDPMRSSELVTQASYGEKVQLLEVREGWYFVRLSDGYLGWISQHAFAEHTSDAHFRDNASHVVCRRFQPVFGLEGRQVMLLPWNTPLPIAEFRDGMAYWTGPDGQPVEIAADALIPIQDKPAPTVAGCQEALEQILQFVGVPYIWGGTTAYGFDCSGLAQSFYRWLDIALPRDADQQVTSGYNIEQDSIQPGDLLFWATQHSIDRHHNINHVSIALDNELMIHANQRRWGISVDLIDEIQSNYANQAHPGLISIKRIVSS